MGFLSPPPPPPPPPLPPAANPVTIANPQTQTKANNVKAKMAGAAGSGYAGTDITKPLGEAMGGAPTAKSQLLGG